MKAKTLRQWAHVHMNCVRNAGPDGNGWYTLWVLWGPYVGQWSYNVSAGSARLHSKKPIGRSWAAGASYLRRFPAGKWNNKTVWKHVVSGFSRNGCSILHDFLYRQEDVIAAKSERYVRSVLEYRTKEALEKIPEWALNLYRRHKMLNWDIIALNPSQEFWTWLESTYGKDQITTWASLMGDLNMKKCSPENFYRKLYCRGITRRAIDEAVETNQVSYLKARMGGLTVSEITKLSSALGMRLTLSDFDDKLAIRGLYQQVLNSYDGSITKEQYNSWMKEGTWGTSDWGKLSTNIARWEEDVWGLPYPVYESKVFEPEEDMKRLVWAQKKFRDLLYKGIFLGMFPGEKIEYELTSDLWWIRLWRFCKGKSNWNSRIDLNPNSRQMLELFTGLGIEYTLTEQTKPVKDSFLHIKDLGSLGSETWYKLMLLAK